MTKKQKPMSVNAKPKGKASGENPNYKYIKLTP